VTTPTPLPVDAVMHEVEGRVRERLRTELRRHGASDAFEQPEVFAAVDELLRRAAAGARPGALLLPDVLGDPSTWRLETAMHYRTHRQTFAGRLIVGAKRTLLMPVFRWLFEFSRDNFERQARVNTVLFACIQELAIENARLRADLQRGATGQ
jgi:hypothetical protein